MKKIVLTVAMALALALPIAGTPTVNADPLYGVRHDTNLWQHSFARGHVRCHIRNGDRVYRHWGANWSRWIYVKHYRWIRDGQNSRFEETGCRGWFDKHGHISYAS